MKEKPLNETVRTWLRDNLGKGCLAPLTGADARALDAAIYTIELYSYDRSDEVAQAFGLIVGRMQPKTQELAFHAIAQCMEWMTRFELWERAGLELPKNIRVCAWEPGGSARN
ncbi:MAG: hypothetical protein JWM68_3751 [Verrucomicrobiales bacterium]|nr:hypothetical protein [Verrucomicrobiales bacterium]